MKQGNLNSIAQVLNLQAMAYETAVLLAADVREVTDKERRAKIAQSFSQVLKSWETLEDRKRILRGKPLPGSKRPAVEQPKRSKATPYGSPSE